MTTIIIPAHNEAKVINNCLESVVNQKGVNSIIVACNGCTDNTVEIVRKKYPQILCLDIQKPSKTHALNEAEKHISSFPVFYLDADTRLSKGAIPLITEYLANNAILLAAPEPLVDTSTSSWLVKQYYKIWLNLPYVKDGVIGTCSFILSEKGRARFETFPEIISDDGYVRCCYNSEEITNIEGANIYIQAPKNFMSLIKIKTRARLGNMQLNSLNLCSCPKQANYSNSIKEKLFSKDFISTITYLAIALIIRVRAYLQFRNLETYRWEKDLTTR